MSNSVLPPVVLIHGMWSVPEALIDVKEAFEAEGYEVHTPRLPYHFLKREMTKERKAKLAETSIQDYVTVLNSFVQTLDQPPIIVGHSMGGLLAQLVAARNECAKLILISSAPPAGVNGWSWSAVRTIGHNLFKFPPWRSVTNLLLKNIAYGIANTQPASTHKEIVKMATFDSSKVSMQIGFWFLFLNAPTRVAYEAIQCPVLILGGTEDKITPIKIQRKLSKRYGAKAKYVELKGACHWTIGGTYFPQIKAHIFDWLGRDRLKQAA